MYVCTCRYIFTCKHVCIIFGCPKSFISLSYFELKKKNKTKNREADIIEIMPVINIKKLGLWNF